MSKRDGSVWTKMSNWNQSYCLKDFLVAIIAKLSAKDVKNVASIAVSSADRFSLISIERLLESPIKLQLDKSEKHI